jgi:twitching motility protein PilT
MSLVPSLLQAIVHLDGEALVMHAGDKPYVVSPSGQVDLATRGLALDAINGIVNHLLPLELQNALDEFGAVQYEIPARSEFPGEHFTVVAARGGDDIWVEVRRRRLPDEDRIPEEFFPPPEEAAKAQPYPVYVSAVSSELIRPVESIPHSLEIEARSRTAAGHEANLDARDAVVHQETDNQSSEVRGEQHLQVAAHQTVENFDPPAPLAWQPTVEVAPDAFFDTATEPVASLDEPGPLVDEEPMWVTEEMPSLGNEPQFIDFGMTSTADFQSEDEPAASAVAEVVVGPSASDVVAPPPIAVLTSPEPVAEVAPPPVAAEVVAPPAAADVAQPPFAVASPPRDPISQPAAFGQTPQTSADAVRPRSVPPETTEPAPEPMAAEVAPQQPAVVLPLSRNPIRSEQPLPPIGDPTMSGLDRLLRLSAARGASTLYLSSQSRPSVRVDSELQTLEGEPILTSRDVESLLLTLMPERSHEALRTGAATEWIVDIEDVGRVRCMSFRDHLGPGGVFRLMPTRSVSADQLALPKVVQALAVEPEGLVLVAGPRSSGKRTLMSAFVDLINRTRRDHVITIEREINIVHERGSSFISQREVRGNDEEMLAAARAALREDPDVLIIEELRTAALVSVALDASQSGHLVIGGFSAHTATAAVDRIIDLYAPEQRHQVQLALAGSLRGVVSQVLLKKQGGGRVAAREVLLNTPAVSSVIAEGKTSQLPMAIEGGRRYGMMPLNDALVGLVQQGVVDGREAYRYATDRAGLLALLARQGLDTSFVEKLA